MSHVLPAPGRPVRRPLGAARRGRLALVLAAGGLLLAGPATHVGAQSAVPLRPLKGGPATFIPDVPDTPLQPARRVVLLIAGSDLAGIVQGLQLTLVDGLVAKGMYLLDTPAGMTDGEFSELIATLEGKPGVVFAEPDGRSHSNEVKSCEGGGTPAGGQPQQCTVGFVDGTPTSGEFYGQSAVTQIRADAAQTIPHPFTPVVAVIDTGVDMSHPIFAGKLFSPGWDFVDGHAGGWDAGNGQDDDGDGLVDEAVGHGTHIAGSVLLIAPHARILPVRALDSDGWGSGYRVAESIFYAVDSGASVINLSLSFPVMSAAVVASLQYAEALGVTVITSAGNTGGEVLFPGDYEPTSVTWILPVLPPLTTILGSTVLTVAAVDAADKKAGFSAYGAYIDVAAPGVAVYSAVPGGGYAWWSGTSMATGIASGAAALMVGISGPWPLTDAAELLEDNAKNIDAKNPAYAGLLGHGRIDAWAAGLDALLP